LAQQRIPCQRGARQLGNRQTEIRRVCKSAAPGLVLTDLAPWSLTGLKLFLVGENPLSAEGELGPGVSIVPSPCSHNAWLMPACHALLALQDGKKKITLSPHTRMEAGCVVMTTPSYSCQVFISFHSNIMR